MRVKRLIKESFTLLKFHENKELQGRMFCPIRQIAFLIFIITPSDQGIMKFNFVFCTTFLHYSDLYMFDRLRAILITLIANFHYNMRASKNSPFILQILKQVIHCEV